MRCIKCVIISLFVLNCLSCSKRTGSPENPIQIPKKELMKLMDATGGPKKTYETPTIFVVNLNNQTNWFLTSIEIKITNTNSGSSRNYIGNPFAFIVERNKYDKITALSPKSSGHFIFSIGTILSFKEQHKNSSSYLKEYVFEPYTWSIVKANGYKK